MIYQSEYSERAQRELLDAYLWYEEQQKGLGDRFISEVFKVVNRIEKARETYPKKIHLFRETKTNTFPFLVIYRVSKKEKRLIITSIFHTSRNPWKKYSKK